MNVTWIEHKGKRILYANYQGQQPEQMLETARIQAKLMQESPTKVLLLTNMEDSHINHEVMQEIKILGKEIIEAKTERRAIVGISTLQTVFMGAYRFFTRSTVQEKTFDSEEAAKEWLVGPTL